MNDKSKALELALGQIEKQFGKGSIMKLGESPSMMNLETLSTGCLDLDLALAALLTALSRYAGIFSAGSTIHLCHFLHPPIING